MVNVSFFDVVKIFIYLFDQMYDKSNLKSLFQV